MSSRPPYQANPSVQKLVHFEEFREGAVTNLASVDNEVCACVDIDTNDVLTSRGNLLPVALDRRPHRYLTESRRSEVVGPCVVGPCASRASSSQCRPPSKRRRWRPTNWHSHLLFSFRCGINRYLRLSSSSSSIYDDAAARYPVTSVCTAIDL